MDSPVAGRTGARARNLVPLLQAVLLMGLAAGCGEVGPPPTTVPLPQWEAPAGDGLLQDPALQAVAELGLQRDGPALMEYLANEDARIRARAAFALASVGMSEAQGPLTDLLEDPEPAVRAQAAFALGHLALADGGAALADALAAEQDADVQERLLEALGRVGDQEAVRRVAEAGPRPGWEVAWVRALARAGARGMAPGPVLDAMLEAVSYPDPEVRRHASYFFSSYPDPAAWSDEVQRLRDALDGYEADDPAALYLLLGLGVQRQRADAERIVRWLESAEDWRVRAGAARALGGTAMLETPGVREALFRALDDEAYQVGATAALALTRGFRIPQAVLDRARAWVRSGPEHWPTHLPFIAMFLNLHEIDVVVDWTRSMLQEHPDVGAVAVGFLASTDFPGDMDFFEEMSTHEHPRVRGAAFAALVERWPMAVQEEDDLRDWHDRFSAELRAGSPPSAVPAAWALSSAALLQVDEGAALRAAYERAVQEDRFHLAEAVLDALARTQEEELVEMVAEALEHTDFRIRRAAARALEGHLGREVSREALELPNPEVAVDWGLLANLGPEPRLRLRTERGEMVLRLVPEQAPLTVQALVQQVRAGLHDDVPFHRVEPGHLIQGGDWIMHDGTGSPGLLLRTELTRLPFERGAVGMASAGRDTETSQFFILQSMEPTLEEDFTAFGWLEEGAQVLDRIRPWDRVLEASVEPLPDS